MVDPGPNLVVIGRIRLNIGQVQRKFGQFQANSPKFDCCRSQFFQDRPGSGEIRSVSTGVGLVWEKTACILRIRRALVPEHSMRNMGWRCRQAADDCAARSSWPMSLRGCSGPRSLHRAAGAAWHGASGADVPSSFKGPSLSPAAAHVRWRERHCRRHFAHDVRRGSQAQLKKIRRCVRAQHDS